MSGRERQPEKGGAWRHRRIPATSTIVSRKNVEKGFREVDPSLLRFAGGADLGLATTACSSSLLTFHRIPPSPVGSSTYSSRVTSPGSFLSGSSGSAQSSFSQEKDVGCSDLATLYPLTQDSILHNLTARYKRDHIYVSDISFELPPLKGEPCKAKFLHAKFLVQVMGG